MADDTYTSYMPPPPDFLFCNEFYGSALDTNQCRSAVDEIPSGVNPVVWHPNSRGRGQYVLPFQSSMGSVYVTIERTGVRPPSVWESPRRLFDLGVFLCERCVKEQGKGGFATLGFNSATQWAQNHSPPFVWRTIPSIDATFFTVTVSGPTNKLYSPGNTDPAISLAIGSNIAAMTDPGDPQSLKENKEKEAYWNERSTQMTRGSTTAWWSLGPTEAKPEMIYQCDSSLGTPSASDCTAIEWQQLAVQPGTLTVGPEAIFFHVNTCYLAISAAAVIILTWNQIRTAVSALTDTCIQHPYQAAQGGRAYLGPPPTSQDGMRKYKRQNAQLIGWNALPPHVNITMFKQSEPWTNPAAELRTCTWQAALNGRSTLSCTSA